jgi:outer membrane translocation and assembly module TamA
VLGGNDSFAGYKVEELRGAHLGAVNLEYRYRLNELPSAVGGGIFLVATGSIGNAWKTLDEIEDDFFFRIRGQSRNRGDTILGPVRADFAIGKSGRRIIYLNIGYKF